MRAMAFNKLCQLMGTASPYSRLVVDDKDTREMIAAGLMVDDGKGFTITPNGLRRLADQMESGHVAAALGRLKRENEARRSKMPTR